MQEADRYHQIAMTTPPTTPATADIRIATLRVRRTGEGQLELAIPDTHYRMELKPVRPVSAAVGKRVRGIVRVSVWKVDWVNPGGAFVDPVFGRPRRVQGRVIGRLEQGRGIVVSVAGCPFCAELPPRWPAGEIAIGGWVGLEVYDGATFEPID